MTRRLNFWLVVLLVVVGLPYYWLLIDNRSGDAAVKPVSIAQLRQLAASMPGTAPSGIEIELVAFRRLPGTLFVAGGGFKRNLLGVMAFRLPVAGGRPIVVDSGMTKAAANQMGMEKYDFGAQVRVDNALREAGLILLTHEHMDHEGGLVALGDPGVFAHARLNAAQLPGAELARQMPWPKGLVLSPTLTGTTPQAVAPGVVVIPAPSHTPGSQMIFVRLADGREYLFAGDIATMARSWEQLRARSRLIGSYVAAEDRGEVYAWLRTIRALKAAAPQLVVVPGHDYEWIAFHEQHRGMKDRFSSSPKSIQVTGNTPAPRLKGAN
ncbi:MAG TPA: MBL fold metallo-hydrolase [Novosphingobium sp.]|nr:MBL fold metallo-hydrolase [Novosphingobium sp.]